MFISATDRNTDKKKMPRDLKIVLVYCGVSIFTLVFSMVYHYFGHGVTSPYMTYVSLVPAIGGLVPFAFVWLVTPFQMPHRISFNLINAGVGTASVGCAMRGAFVIADKAVTAPLYLAGFGVLLWLLGLATGWGTCKKNK